MFLNVVKATAGAVIINIIVVGLNQQGVCVVESSCVSCFMEDGSDYQATLPFQVQLS